MTFILKSVVPWGRTFEEYIAMFNLSEADLCRSILGCGDGPAGFNARMYGLGHRMISCDPLYQYPYDQVAAAIEAARDDVMQQVRANLRNFIWTSIRTPEELEQVRMGAMQEFLGDYRAGRSEGRYIPAALPNLPFPDNSFDLCLCSHFLFLYESLGPDFTIRSIREMVRVAPEVRIYPIVDTNGHQADYFGGVRERLHTAGLVVQMVPAGYDFLKNGELLLRISR